jgi:hypothetical protein
MARAYAHFAIAALLACTAMRVRDPDTERMVWLIRCSDGVKAEYLPAFPKSKHKAIRQAKAWLEAHRPKLVVSVEQLRAHQ